MSKENIERWDKLDNIALIKEYQETNNDKLFEYFLNKHYKLIYKFARSFLNKVKYDEKEVLHRCEIVMWECLKNFDTSLDIKFSTYYYWYVKKAIIEYIREENLIKIPAHRLEASEKERNKELIYSSAVLSTDIYLDDIKPGCSDCESTDLYELLVDSDSPSPEDNTITENNNEKIKEMLHKHLSARSEKIMLLKLGLIDGKSHTLQEIANRYSLSRERIRQIIVRAIKKLRPIVGKYLDISFVKNKDYKINLTRNMNKNSGLKNSDNINIIVKRTKHLK